MPDCIHSLPVQKSMAQFNIFMYIYILLLPPLILSTSLTSNLPSLTLTISTILCHFWISLSSSQETSIPPHPTLCLARMPSLSLSFFFFVTHVLEMKLSISWHLKHSSFSGNMATLLMYLMEPTYFCLPTPLLLLVHPSPSAHHPSSLLNPPTPLAFQK